MGVSGSYNFYGRLLLENKLLAIFALLLAFLGATLHTVQHWATVRVTEELLIDELNAGLENQLGPLSQAIESREIETLSAILSQVAEQDLSIITLLVADTDGRPLAGIPSADAATVQPPDQAAHRLRLWFDDSPIEHSIPLAVSGQPVGSVRVALDRSRAIRPAYRASFSVMMIMVIPVGLVLLTARMVVRRAVDPLKQLTQAADEISTGNLYPRIDIGVRVNCWEIKQCQQTECPAYLSLSQQCWYIDGTPCEGYEPRFPQKLVACRTCEVYQAHRGDEIVQLADALKHMTHVLVDSQEELVKSEDFQKRLIRSSFDGIVATVADDTITIFNRMAEELIGYSRDEVVGLLDWRVFFEDGLEKIMDKPITWGRVRRTRGFPPRESVLKRRDGSLIAVRLAGISIFERGRRIGRVFYFQDMREINHLREELIRSERLAATGQAAAGISHSVRNILDGLRGGIYVYQVGRRRGDDQKIEVGWEMIERNIEIISDLVKDLLSFAKDRKPDYEEVDPAELISELLASLGVSNQNRVTVEADIAPGSEKVKLDRHTFSQCLGNLVRNAMEAIPPNRNGTVQIAVRTAGDRAWFTVTDDGTGMNPETIKKIKGGMYSTKGAKGTGLGLLVIQKIVKEHDGILAIDSEEGKGSTFSIEMPLEPGSADRQR
jgi:PAS domain S-box-containing protein